MNVITTGIECKMLRKMASCRLLDRPLANQLIQSVDNFMFDCDGKCKLNHPNALVLFCVLTACVKIIFMIYFILT